MFRIIWIHLVFLATLTPIPLALAESGFSGKPSVQAPDIQQQRAAMDHLSFLRGHWIGEKRSRKPDGTIEISRSRDDIELTPDGLLLKIQGRAYATNTTSEPVEVGSNFGVVRYDEISKRYEVNAFSLGNALKGSGVIIEGGVMWILDSPGQKIRFTLKSESTDGWIETGDFSFDGGVTWRSMFEIRFQRVQAVGTDLKNTEMSR